MHLVMKLIYNIDIKKDRSNRIWVKFLRYVLRRNFQLFCDKIMNIYMYNYFYVISCNKDLIYYIEQQSYFKLTSLTLDVWMCNNCIVALWFVLYFLFFLNINKKNIDNVFICKQISSLSEETGRLIEVRRCSKGL